MNTWSGGIRRGHPLPSLLITFPKESIVSELHLAAVVDVVGTEFVVYIRCPSCLVTTATRGRIFNSCVPFSQAYNSSIAIRTSFPVTSFNLFALPSFELRVGSMVDLQVGPRPTKVLYACTLCGVVILSFFRQVHTCLLFDFSA